MSASVLGSIFPPRIVAGNASCDMLMLTPFEAVYVINLPSRTDRRDEMSEQLKLVGLSFDSPHVHLFPAVRPRDNGGFESIGARGCFMSHLEVLRAANGKKNVLILEDDLNFSPHQRKISLPENWGLFYGGARHALHPESELTVVSATQDLVCAHFVAFNGSVIPRVIEFLEQLLTREPGDPEGGPMHVDGAYNVFRARNPDVLTLIATPELGTQRPSRSDIAPLKWFDKIAGVRSLVGVARSLRARP